MNKLVLSLPIISLLFCSFTSSFKKNENFSATKKISAAERFLLATISSAANGNWTAGGTWTGGVVPASNDATTVNNNVTVNANLTVSNSLTVSATGTLIDPAGGTNYTLNVVNSGAFNVYGNTTFGGAMTVQNTAVVHIYAGATLTVGSLALSGNTNFIIDAGGTLIVNGTLDIANSNAMTINGRILVNGNVVISNAASSTGTGFVYATGTITTNNSSTLLGSTANCSVAPCYATTGAGVASAPLPVTYTSFSAKQNNNLISLYWQTASEQNNNYFEIQRSIDGINFEIIGKSSSKADANGNSSKLLNYTFEDKNPLSGFSYYRLKQIDFNGKFEYSSIVSIDFEASKNISFVVSPNPNKGEFSIDFKGIENNHAITVNVIDMNGRIVYDTTVYPENITANSFKIVPTQSIKSGNYIIRLGIEGITHAVKMLVD